MTNNSWNHSSRIVFATIAPLPVGGAARTSLRSPELEDSTNDACLREQLHPVSARAHGTVIAALTADNRVVKERQPLVKLDLRGFQVRLAEASNEETSARAAMAQALIRQGARQPAQAEAGDAQASAQLQTSDQETARI
jgi:membrane fusion protein (multidrug efflux system)